MVSPSALPYAMHSAYFCLRLNLSNTFDPSLKTPLLPAPFVLLAALLFLSVVKQKPNVLITLPRSRADALSSSEQSHIINYFIMLCFQ